MKTLKKQLAVLMLLMLLALPARAAEPFGWMQVTGCEEWISLRAEPDKVSERLQKIPLGALITFYSESENGFSHVYYNGEIGYVLTEFLTDLQPIPMYVDNCSEWISLRAEPDKASERLQKIPLGARVTAIGRANDDFLLVEYNGQRGYALTGFLTPLSFFAELRTATLQFPTGGEIETRTTTDPAALSSLAGLIRGAAPSDFGKCPHILLLTLTSADETAVRFTLAADGCPTLIAENGAVYALPEPGTESILSLFGLSLEDLFD